MKKHMSNGEMYKFEVVYPIISAMPKLLMLKMTISHGKRESRLKWRSCINKEYSKCFVRVKTLGWSINPRKVVWNIWHYCLNLNSEFVSEKATVEEIIEFRYVLRMLGVPTNGLLYLFGDAESVFVVDYASTSDFSLKHRHLKLCFQKMQEALAAGIITDSDKNPFKILTKSLSHPALWKLMNLFFIWLILCMKRKTTKNLWYLSCRRC